MAGGLKACPFCPDGGRPVYSEYEKTNETHGYCDRCGAQGPGGGRSRKPGAPDAEATARWNRRPIEDALCTERDAAVARAEAAEAKLAAMPRPEDRCHGEWPCEASTYAASLEGEVASLTARAEAAEQRATRAETDAGATRAAAARERDRMRGNVDAWQARAESAERRLRITAALIIEAIGSVGPEDAEDAARRLGDVAVERDAALARADAAERELAKLRANKQYTE